MYGENMSSFKTLWQYVYDQFGGNEVLIVVIGTTLILNIFFWSTNALLLSADLLNWPKWMRNYKVQQDKQVTEGEIKKAFNTAVLNVVFFNLIFFYPLIYLPMRMVGSSVKVEDVPGWSRILLEIVIFTLVQEITFYYLHRLFHHPLLYKHVHKKHHEFTAPIGLVAVYAAPAEHIVVNGTSITLGAIMMGSHLVTFWIWLMLATVVTIVHHSGYHLPFLPSPEFHDFHHLKFNYNFGTLGILDWLHGTDSMWKGTIQSKRHRTLYGLTPMSQTIK